MCFQSLHEETDGVVVQCNVIRYQGTHEWCVFRRSKPAPRGLYAMIDMGYAIVSHMRKPLVEQANALVHEFGDTN